MYLYSQHIHSFLAYAVLALLVLAFANALGGWIKKRPIGRTELKLGKFTTIATHTQILLGILLYVVSPMVKAALSDFGGAMKDSTLRLYALEHPFTMIIAAVLITIASSKTKKEAGQVTGLGRNAILYGLALVLVVSRIPWSAWHS